MTTVVRYTCKLARCQYTVTGSDSKWDVQLASVYGSMYASLSRPRPFGAGIAQLVVLGLAVHSIVGSILLWGHFPVEGIFPLELTWVQTPFPQKLLRMRV